MNAIRAALGKVVFIMAIVTACPAIALAQGDEIQVYDGGLADPGVFNLTWHNNYTFSGAKAPEFPGAYAANHALNGVTEWAYGVNKWWEVGLYLPLYTVSESSTRMNGFKLRTLFATPNAGDRTFFYGLGIELSDNAKSWDQTRITSEFRPIVGWINWCLHLPPALLTTHQKNGPLLWKNMPTSVCLIISRKAVTSRTSCLVWWITRANHSKYRPDLASV